MNATFSLFHLMRRLVTVALISCLAAFGLAIAAPTVAAAAVAIRCTAWPTVRSIVAADSSTYSLDSNGSAWGWGDNLFGQIGNGASGPTPVTSPLNASGFSSLQAISAGARHVLVLRQDGSVWTWGDNSDGELGDGTTNNHPVPEQVQGLPTNVVAVDAGNDGYNSFAVTATGTVFGWGSNNNGQLGDGTQTDSHVAKQIPGLTNYKAVSASAFYTLGLKGDGTVWAWGYSVFGELGSAVADGTITPTPVQIAGLPNNIVAISAGNYHGTALGSDGTVWSWGYGAQGQLGNNTFSESRVPVQARTSAGVLTGVTQVAAGGFFTLALTSAGTVYGWGDNQFGQTGSGGALGNQGLATPVSSATGLGSVAELSSGEYNGVALATTGKVWDWGTNSSGQIGNGTTDPSDSAPQARPYQTAIGQSLPATPKNVQAAAGNAGAYLTWTAPTSAVTQYVITPYLNGTAQAPVATPVTAAPAGSPPGVTSSYMVSGLTPGGNYTFTVAAANCLGTGSATAQSASVVPTNAQVGDQSSNTETSRLSDRMTLHVNTFNGNLSVSAHDLRIRGTGLDLSVDRTYNSKATTTSIFGQRWAAGPNVSLAIGAKSATFTTPAGGQLGFAGPGADGKTFTAPSGADATLVKNTDGTYTLTDHASGSAWNFTSAGVATTHVDRNGNTVTYAHAGPGGALSSITDTQGRVTTLTYNTSNLVSKITDSAGRLYQYGYDANLNLTSYTDPATGVAKFAYDANHNLTQITTPAGRVVTVGYDTGQRAASIGHPNQTGNPTTAFSYNPTTCAPGTSCTVVTDPNTHTTTYNFDPVGRITGVTDGAGNKTANTYTSDSNIATYSTGNGSATGAYAYDGQNNLTSSQVAPGAHSTMGYTDPNHPFSPTTVTDPQNNTTSVAYDAKGNPITATDPLASQNQVQVTYNPNGTMATSKDPDGHQTSYGYDAKGNLTSVTAPAPLGGQSVTPDSVSRPSKVTDGKGQATTYTYDALDRVTQATYSDGKTLKSVYDADGNLTSMTDVTGTTTMVYDAMGRMTSRTTPDTKTVSYTYDGVGNMLTLTDQSGTTTYAYFANNLPRSVTDPAGHWIQLTYDANYNRTGVIDPNGYDQFMTYDSANRVTGVTTYDYTHNHAGLNDPYSYKAPNQTRASARAVTPRGTPSTYVNNTSAGTSAVTLAAPAGLQSGDVEVAQIDVPNYGAVSSVPAGWTLVRSDGTSLTQSIYVHVVTGVEPVVYSWSLAQPVDASGGLSAWTGIDNNNPVETSAGQYTSTASTSATAPSVSYQNGEFDLTFYSDNFAGAAAPVGVPPNTTEAYDTQTWYITSALDTQTVGRTAGTTGAQTVTVPNGWWVGQQVLLRPVYDTSLLQSTPDGTKSYDALNRLTASGSTTYTYDGASNRLTQSWPDGRLWASGLNGNGQVGNNSTTDVHGWASIANLKSATGGWYHTLGLRNDGTLWAWGSNSNGQLGNNSTTQSTVPIQVPGLTGVIQAAAGQNHSLALKSDGTVWAWGLNSAGQLGNNTTTDVHVPTQVAGLSGIVAISAGAWDSYALKSDGTVWAWGLNNVGELGNNSSVDSHVPVQVSGLTGVSAIAGGYAHALARKKDGTAWSWGLNGKGQLGNGTATNALTPVQVTGLTNVLSVAGGYSHSVALLADGTLRAWGDNSAGELGNGTTTQSLTPVTVPGLTNVRAVGLSGGSHTLALTGDTRLWLWGYNVNGQIGNGTTTNVLSPIQIGNGGYTSVGGGLDVSYTSYGGGESATYAYNGANELTSAGTRTFSYDGNGSLTGTNDGAAAVYDTGNRATSMTNASSTGATTFTYRGGGQSERASMSPATRVGTQCQTLSPCPGTTLGATDTFENSRLGVSAETVGSSTTYYVRDPRGGILAEVTGGTPYYYITDGHGSVVQLMDGVANVAATYSYDSYGQLTNVSGGAVATSNPWRYVGAYQDGTGLYHMGERYYDPTTGRFTQQDAMPSPLDPSQWNRFAYVGGDPVNRTDPSGLCSLNPFNSKDDCYSGAWKNITGNPSCSGSAALGDGMDFVTVDQLDFRPSGVAGAGGGIFYFGGAVALVPCGACQVVGGVIMVGGAIVGVLGTIMDIADSC